MKAVLNRVLVTLVSLVLTFLFCASAAPAQTSSPRGTPPAPKPLDGAVKSSGDEAPPLSSFEEEMRAKHAIKLAEKDHQENLERAREIGLIGKELQESLKVKSTLDRDSLKKVERLEKLTKKIRDEAGGEDEEISIINRPSDVPSAVTQIAEAAGVLSKNVQDTPRQVVSASVIGNANVLLELIKILRTFVR